MIQSQNIEKNVNIENLIYEIRGTYVMLDSDLADLFDYETKNLNRQVLRNKNRFPENYCFQLTKEEYNSLRCQNVTLKSGRGQHKKYMPYVFTEHGITMLAGILKSDKAIKMSLKIVDTFIKMKHFIKYNLLEQSYINNLVLNLDNKVNYIDNEVKSLQEAFDKLEEKELKNKLFYDGKLYDAYSFIVDILNKCESEIIIIDNYADKILLDIISNINKKITIITKKNSLLKDIDIKKYNKQYSNLKIIYSNSFHDRFIILDMNKLYLLGASINHIGNKITSIISIEEEVFKKDLFKKIQNII